MKFIPYNKSYINNLELNYLNKTIKSKCIGNIGEATYHAQNQIKKIYTNSQIILTHSCSAALEMISILINIKKGDEVIVPSFAFISTANAFAMRGAKIIFADICRENLNIDINCILKLITNKTKAIVAVHYAGNSCNLSFLKKICKQYKIFLIEDAAQAFMSRDKNKKLLGTFGHFATLSFHETKNVVAGQGGALLINSKGYYKRAIHLRDKGSNRYDFDNRTVKKYTWVDFGSSYTIGEISASILNAQLKKKNYIINKKKFIWKEYYRYLKPYDGMLFQLPKKNNQYFNAHIFYILLKSQKTRKKLQDRTKNKFQLISHYEPLHLSKAGKKFGLIRGSLKNTIYVANRILRLPSHLGVNKSEIKLICDTIIKELSKISSIK